MSATREQLTEAAYALQALINLWNDSAADGDRGRDNGMLVLTMWDDGSGRIGLSHTYETDDGAFCSLNLNIQDGFNDVEGLVDLLLEWAT